MHRLQHADVQNRADVLPVAVGRRRELTEDWLVDDQPLHRLVAEVHDADHFEFVLSTDPRWPARFVTSALDELRTSRRHVLYVCSQCGDEGCGFFSVLVTVEAETVTWSEFENGYDDTVDDPADDRVVAIEHVDDPIGGLGPFVFDRATYEDLLDGVSARWADLAPDQRLTPRAPEQPPRRRWWQR